jgi:hypothetical protein
MDERRVGRQGRLEIVDDGERLQIDLDQRGRLGCDLRGHGGDGGDDVTLEPHDLLREEAAILDVGTVA